MYIIESEKIIFGTNFPDEEKFNQVPILLEAYYIHQEKIYTMIYDEIKYYFGGVLREEIFALLGNPLIDLDKRTISYLDNKLDESHIVELEFGGFIDKIYQVNVDG